MKSWIPFLLHILWGSYFRYVSNFLICENVYHYIINYDCKRCRAKNTQHLLFCLLFIYKMEKLFHLGNNNNNIVPLMGISQYIVNVHPISFSLNWSKFSALLLFNVTKLICNASRQREMCILLTSYTVVCFLCLTCVRDFLNKPYTYQGLIKDW